MATWQNCIFLLNFNAFPHTSLMIEFNILIQIGIALDVFYPKHTLERSQQNKKIAENFQTKLIFSKETGKILTKSKTCLNWISLSPLLRYFHFFNLFHWNNGNNSKVTSGKPNFNQFWILLRSLQCVFWIEGYANLD